MKLQLIDEPALAFYEGKLHVDIRAGLASFGAFDKGSEAVPGLKGSRISTLRNSSKNYASSSPVDLPASNTKRSSDASTSGAETLVLAAWLLDRKRTGVSATNLAGGVATFLRTIGKRWCNASRSDRIRRRSNS